MEKNLEQNLQRLQAKTQCDEKALALINAIAQSDKKTAKNLKQKTRKESDKGVKLLENIRKTNVTPSWEQKRTVALYNAISKFAADTYNFFADEDKRKEDEAKAQIKAEKEEQRRIVAERVKPSKDIRQSLENLRQAFKQTTLYLRTIINISRSEDLDGKVKDDCKNIVSQLCSALDISIADGVSDNALAKLMMKRIKDVQNYISTDGVFVKVIKLPFKTTYRVDKETEREIQGYKVIAATNEDIVKMTIDLHTTKNFRPSVIPTPTSIKRTNAEDTAIYYNVEFKKAGNIATPASIHALKYDICRTIDDQLLDRQIKQAENRYKTLAEQKPIANRAPSIITEPTEPQTEQKTEAA